MYTSEEIVRTMHETLASRGLRCTRNSRLAYLIGYRDSVLAVMPKSRDRQSLLMVLSHLIRAEKKQPK